MPATLNPKTGLLQTEDELLSSGMTSPGQVAGASQSQTVNPLAGVLPNLAPNAVGVQQQNIDPMINASGKQFAFNPKYAAMDQALQRAIANASSERTGTLQSLDANFQKSTSEAQRQNVLAQKGLAAQMSTRGLGFSGINLDEQGNLNDTFNRYIGSLNDQYAGGRASTENQYGRTLGTIAAQREGLYGQQVDEEHQAAIQRAREEAEAQSRREAAQRQEEMMRIQIANQGAQQAAQQQWMQQMMAQQQAALAQANSIGYQSRSNPYAGAGFGGGGPSAADLSALSMDQLTSLYQVPQLPEDLRVQVRKRIVDMNTPSSPNYYPQPVGHRDQPYGFNQGGIAL